MAGQSLDDFLTEETASKMEWIEGKIREEVSGKICEYYGINSTNELSEDQIRAVAEAQDSRKKGFIKLGYNLLLRELREKP